MGPRVAAEGAPVSQGARLSAGELAAWRAYLRGHATVTRALEADLVAGPRLSLASYDVLVQLVEAPGGRLRMTELAGAVLLSRSGVTRLVDRLEKDGLVVRAPVAEDGRGVAATITDLGIERLRGASRIHLDGVARYFAARLDAADLAELRRISERLS
jgi:DNA-binding MarR family transcriptional regulator